MIKINPGDLNRRIKIYSYNADDAVSDEAGGFEDVWGTKEGWTHVCDAWASVRPASERAQEYAEKMMVTISHTVLVRYNSAIKSDQSIKYDGRKLDIQTIRNFDESNKYLQLMCIEDTGTEGDVET